MPETVKVITPRARKAHTCFACRRTIHVGESYMRATVRNEDALDTLDTHTLCDYSILALGEDEAVTLGEPGYAEGFLLREIVELRELAQEKELGPVVLGWLRDISAVLSSVWLTSEGWEVYKSSGLRSKWLDAGVEKIVVYTTAHTGYADDRLHRTVFLG